MIFVDLIVAQMEVEAGAHFRVEVCDLLGRWKEVEPIALAELEGGLGEQIDQSVGQAKGGKDRWQVGRVGYRETPAGGGAWERVGVDGGVWSLEKDRDFGQGAPGACGLLKG